jgi:peptidoglycan hydrolase-like protein with peptidoglycan-binding domain
MDIYTRIEDIPLDQWNGFDEEDQGFTLEVSQEAKGFAALSTSVNNPTVAYVPFKRTLKLGSRGQDVFAVKRALSSAGFGKWGKWGTMPRLFGPYAVKHLKGFQKTHGLKVDGVYGLYTHKKLASHIDAYGRYLIGLQKVRPPKRDAIVQAVMLGYQHRYNIHYTQGSLRMQGVTRHLRPPNYPNYADCSSFATWAYWVAGAADPNGLGYNGYGYTGTLINHGRRISRSQLQPGDLVFYGHNYIPSHVAIYVGGGRIVSHGSESGPLLLPVGYRSDIHSYRSYL